MPAPGAGAEQQQQAPDTGAGAAQPSSSPSAAGQKVEGCLGGSAGNFTVTDDSGTVYALELPAGADSSVLTKHVGERVIATGKMSGSGSASAASSSGASGGKQSIQVVSLDKIPGSCGAQGSGAAETPKSK
jgi:hypothetical protein